MNFKRIASAGMALTMAATLAPAALADEPMPISPAPISAGYQTQLFFNGEALDASAIPAVETGMVPMRLFAESDGGQAIWFEEEQAGFFNVGDHRFNVDFTDLSVELDGEKVEGAKAILLEGVTFLPVELLNGTANLSASLTEGEEARIDLSTPNGRPLNKLVNSIIEEVEIAAAMKNSPEELQEYMGIDLANFDEILAVSPMMVNADTIFVGRYAEKADKAAAKEQFQAVLDRTISSFEHYLPDAYDMAKNGKIVESEDGSWLMLIISADNDKAIEMFNAGVKAMAEAE